MASSSSRFTTGFSAALLAAALQAAPSIASADRLVDACAAAAVKAATGRSEAGAFTVTDLSSKPHNNTGFADRYLRTEMTLTVAGQRFSCKVNGWGRVRQLTRLPLEESSLFASQ